MVIKMQKQIGKRFYEKIYLYYLPWWAKHIPKVFIIEKY